MPFAKRLGILTSPTVGRTAGEVKSASKLSRLPQNPCLISPYSSSNIRRASSANRPQDGGFGAESQFRRRGFYAATGSAGGEPEYDESGAEGGPAKTETFRRGRK